MVHAEDRVLMLEVVEIDHLKLLGLDVLEVNPAIV
jgi:hypothetical protein